MEQQAEKDLIERCRGGDRRAFAALVDHYKILVFNLVDGWPESSTDAGCLVAFCRTVQEVVGDVLSAVTAYGAQLQGLYSANAPTVHLALATLALVWVVYDHWQEAKQHL